MTEIVAFASSRQPRYGSESEGSGSGASVSTEKVVPVSKRKSADWPPRLLILGVPQVLLGQGLVWGPQTSSALIVLRIWPLGLTPQRAVSSPVWSSADQTCSRGAAWMPEGNSPWDAPPPTVITSPSLHLGPSGHFFLRLFQNGSNSHAGASVLCLVLFCLLFSS